MQGEGDRGKIYMRRRWKILLWIFQEFCGEFRSDLKSQIYPPEGSSANFLRKYCLKLGIFQHISPKTPPKERQGIKIISIFPIPILIPLHVLILSVFRSIIAELPQISYVHPYINATYGLGPKRLTRIL